MTDERFDAIVVGAGPAGNAAAYTMAKAGLKVLQLERGEYPGSKNVQGAVLYAHSLEKLIPDFREDAPLERHIVEQRLWMLDDASHMGAHYRSEDFNAERPDRYTIIRAQFDKWFSRKVREAGVVLLCETTVLGLLKDASGRVVGVRTDREGGDVYADVVVLGDGVNGLVGQRAGLRNELKPDTVSLTVKEMHFLPQEVIEARFNIKENEGVVIEALGTVTAGMVGLGFIYTNKESISIGIGCLVSHFAESESSPDAILERFKQHPSVRRLLEGSEAKEYSAHLIPEGGFKAIPQLFGDGWVVVGDSGHFVNNLHREGSNLAMTTGQLVGETIVDLKREGRSCNRDNLSEYKRRLDASFVMKDMKKYKNMSSHMHNNPHLMSLYPTLLGQAAQTWFRVDGVDKRTKENEIFASFRKSRKLTGLLGDAFKMARVWR
jgi:electron transfer flavoprotein-quinone oxidoreductase